LSKKGGQRQLYREEKITREENPMAERKSDLSIILRFLRESLDWSQGQLAEAARTTAALIGDYEAGRKDLHRDRLEHLISAMGLGPGRIDEGLAMIEAVRAGARLGRDDPFNSRRNRIEALAAQAGRLAAAFARAVLNLLTTGSEAVHAQDKADFLWRRLKREKPGHRLLLVEEDKRYRNWGLSVLVTRESLAAAPNHPKEALELANLAARIAELAPGTQAWRWRLQGHAGAALTNAHRVCSDLPAARKARARARKLWDDGEPGDPGLLNEALLPWVEAALLRADRELPEALKKIKEALALDNGELRGKILLTKASVHHFLDEPEAATAANLEAVRFIDPVREPRLMWGVSYNLITDLLDLGRAEEARLRLPEVRKLAERLGGERDLVLVSWLEAKVSAGLGKIEEARDGLTQVRRTFQKPEASYDFALVSLDLSHVLLRQGETRRVRAIAQEMAFIFRSQQVHQQALAALRVFCEAAQREAATADLARRVARFLYRAQNDPDLKFEAGAE
jgi:transcriptional regulator with XRE-family HTH domain